MPIGAGVAASGLAWGAVSAWVTVVALEWGGGSAMGDGRSMDAEWDSGLASALAVVEDFAAGSFQRSSI